MVSMWYIVGIILLLIVIFCLGCFYLLRAYYDEPAYSSPIDWGSIEDAPPVTERPANVGFVSRKPRKPLKFVPPEGMAAGGLINPRAETPQPSRSRTKSAAHGKRSSKAKASKPKARSSKSRSRKTA